jgi:sec-independent protein translocase protein TatA
MSIGPPEIILVLLVLLLLFGAKKLPELARGSGRALRIFKAETKGLMDDDDDPDKPAIDAQRSAPEATPVTESEKRTEEL